MASGGGGVVTSLYWALAALGRFSKTTSFLLCAFACLAGQTGQMTYTGQRHTRLRAVGSEYTIENASRARLLNLVFRSVNILCFLLDALRPVSFTTWTRH